MNQIRIMQDADWPRVSEIYTMGLESGIATFNTTCPSFEEWDSNHLKSCRFVYEKDGEVLGWVAVSATSARPVYSGVVELSLYVDPKASHIGIGTALMERVISVAPENNFWTLFSVILETNPASIALNEKCGFRKIGYRERIAKDKFGVWRNTIIFEKRL